MRRAGTFLRRTACINCHTDPGTAATGRFGPDLSHLMSRDTIASGGAATHQRTAAWIQSPDGIKPGCLMPAMNLNDEQLTIDRVTAYLETLRLTDQTVPRCDWLLSI